MSANLISLASKYLEPDLLNKIASAVGEGTNVIGGASGAAIPALLSGLADLASSKDGLRRLEHAMGEQGTHTLDVFETSIGGSGVQDFISNGVRTLTSLFGRSDFSKLAGAVARFAGLNSSASSSLLGILGPLVLGVLGKAASQQGLDSSGIAKLLRSQQDSFRAAMPSSFQEALRSSGYASAPGTVEKSEDGRRWSAQAATQGNQHLRGSDVVLWMLPLLALGAFAWWYFGTDWRNTLGMETARLERSADPSNNANTLPTAATQPGNIPAAATDLATKLSTTLDGVKSALQDIKDEASAKSALPKLEAANSEFEAITQLFGQLPQESKNALAAAISAARPTLETSIDRVLALPGVNAVAKPAIENLRTKLATLSTA
jgi:hypothetical protein